MKKRPTPELLNQEIVVAEHTTTGLVPLHFHEFYELEIVLSGTGTQVLNGCVYDLSPGCVYMLTPIDFHKVSGATSMCILNIEFLEKAVPPELLLQLTKRRNNLFFRDGARAEFMERLARSLDADNADGYSRRRRRCLLELLIIEMLRCEGQADAPEMPDPVSKALSHMFCHFREPISLRDVAQGYTLNYFSALFNKACGMGFSLFLEKLRVNFARQLLATTPYNVAEIGEKSGFSSQAAFFRSFRKICGISPAQYRKSTDKN